MKTYTWEQVNRDYVEDLSTEWVPADVAMGLFEALLKARGELEAYEYDLSGEAYNDPQINDALSYADGDES